MERIKHLTSVAVLIWFAAFATYFAIGSSMAIHANTCITGFTGCK